jgi:hypothetical protein
VTTPKGEGRAVQILRMAAEQDGTSWEAVKPVRPAKYRTARDLANDPEVLAVPQAVASRHLYRGRVTNFAGPKKSGKSTEVGSVVAAVSRGRPILGAPSIQTIVMVATLDESSSDFVRRLKAEGADLDRVLIVEDTAERVTTASLLAAAEEAKVGVLIIDAITDLLSGEIESENDNTAVKNALKPVRAFARRTGCAVMWLHHVNRKTGDSRGASAFEEVADLLLTLSRPEKDPTLRHMEAEGRLGVESFDFRLGPDGIELAAGAPTVLALVEAAVADNPGSSSAAIEKLVGGKAERVRTAIGQLSHLGRIENRATGTGRTSGRSWFPSGVGRGFSPVGRKGDEVDAPPANPHETNPDEAGTKLGRSFRPLSPLEGERGTELADGQNETKEAA